MYPVFNPNEPCRKCGCLKPGVKWTSVSSDGSQEVLEVTCWCCGSNPKLEEWPA